MVVMIDTGPIPGRYEGLPDGARRPKRCKLADEPAVTPRSLSRKLWLN